MKLDSKDMEILLKSIFSVILYIECKEKWSDKVCIEYVERFVKK